ncbi:hypothetical protein DENSPDRAFT_819272 [Dentipellis sp. KUC8613]|nr:hypothetical protein DENSPDRAFT_819272 [Dentipellis sp. KUC8613]
MDAAKPMLVPSEAPVRLPTAVLPLTDKTPSFIIDQKNKSFRHQYANIYFVRLRALRGFVEKEAKKRWKDVKGTTEFPKLVPRVLDVVKGELCFVVGTIYMDMPLKPNVLEDVARDHSTPAPPPRAKIWSEDDNVMVEDESGRILLVGEPLKKVQLVTGIIVGVLGMENSSGEFSVVDLCFAGLAPQEESDNGERMDIDAESQQEYLATVSGLDIGPSSAADAQIQMMVEYLAGEGGSPENQVAASQISRLIIAGNSLAPIAGTEIDDDVRRRRRDNVSFSPHPTLNLSAHLLDLAHSMPIHILPGASDPSGTILPQQPFPRAMLGTASTYSSFNCETNPAYIRLAPGVPGTADADEASTSNGTSSKSSTRTVLAVSGQTLDDMFKYVPSPPATRLGLAEATLRWRHIAPTAPDTLWCHPFFTTDPFILAQTPDIYIIGNQPKFATRLVTDGDRRCRIVLVPSFAKTGVLVLVGLRTLDVKVIRFAVKGMGIAASDPA